MTKEQLIAYRAGKLAKRHGKEISHITASLEKTVAEKTEVIDSLKAENEKLVAENAALKAENDKLVAENAALKAENEKLVAAEKKSSTATSSAKAKGKG